MEGIVCETTPRHTGRLGLLAQTNDCSQGPCDPPFPEECSTTLVPRCDKR